MEQTQIVKGAIARWVAGLGTVLAGIASIGGFVAVFATPAASSQLVTFHQRPCLTTQLGLAMALFHAALWSAAEWKFDQHFGAGAGDRLPRGWEAGVLASTVTIPLLSIPPLYQIVFPVAVVSSRHWFAACLSIVTGLAGHLVIYGTSRPSFRGFGEMLRSRISGDLRKEIAMSLVHSVIITCSVTVPYRVAISGGMLAPKIILVCLLAPPLCVFLGSTAFKLFRYPDALRDKSWIQVRGLFVGFLVMLAITIGCFL